MNVMDFLRRQPRWRLFVFCFIQLLIVAVIDYVTDPDLSLSVFYLLPILIAIFSAGSKGGFIFSIISAAAWFVIDVLTRKTNAHPTLQIWNGLVNLYFFLIFTFTLSALRTARKKQEELSHFIVHDLRSPLSNIMMGLQALTLPEMGPLNDCQRQFLDRAMSSGEWMSSLINSILDLSRMEHGSMKLEVSEVALGDLLEESLQQISLLAEAHQVRLERRNGMTAQRLRLDRALTVRVLVNLLSNAVKFTPPGKTVTLAAEPDGRGVIFSVADQGPGVPPEYLASVFDKFVQLEARKAGVLVGSGLGLTFCRLGVETQGGRIWMESPPGRGATVKFSLPLVV